MRLLLGIWLLASAPDETDTARIALTHAVQTADRPGAKRAALSLAKLNNERSAPALAAAFRAGLTALAEAERDRKKWARELEIHALVHDKSGRQVKGDLVKWSEAKRNFDLVNAKLDGFHAILPHILSYTAKLTSPEAGRGIIQVLRSETEWLPRAWCAEALGGISTPEALAALLEKARTETDVTVKVGLADGLGLKAKESEEARKILASWTESSYWQVRLAAAQGLAKSGDRSVVFSLITMLAREQGRMRNEINECLKKLTGVDKHGEHAAWKAWWEESRDEFLEGRYVPRATERADVRGLSTFYGIPVISTRLAFIIDSSASMRETSTWRPEVNDGPDRLAGNRAIDIARYELKKILRALPEEASFGILLLAGNTRNVFNERLARIGSSREGAIRYVDKFEFQSDGTNILAALQRTCDFAGGGWDAPIREDSIDTIYILTDGVPSAGCIDRQQIVERTLDMIHFKKIVIHGIGIAPPETPLLKALAQGSGGTYVER